MPALVVLRLFGRFQSSELDFKAANHSQISPVYSQGTIQKSISLGTFDQKVLCSSAHKRKQHALSGNHLIFCSYFRVTPWKFLFSQEAWAKIWASRTTYTFLWPVLCPVRFTSAPIKLPERLAEIELFW